MKKHFAKELAGEGIPYSEIETAIDKGYAEWLQYKKDIRNKGFSRKSKCRHFQCESRYLYSAHGKQCH